MILPCNIRNLWPMEKDLAYWIKHISEHEIPIFRYTALAIANGTRDDDVSTAQLAQIILRDASLTARILRISNSVIYNPSRTPINTVSRAIVYIGFDLIRDLSLSLAVIDAILKRRSREHVLQLMARSFHGASLARWLAEKRGDDAPEEVFIAALLYHLGEMAFWCVDEDRGLQIQALIDKHGFKPAAAQKEILGFTFDQLTVGLTHDWHLCDLLHSTINNPDLDTPRIRDIVLSRNLANDINRQWNNPRGLDAVRRIARYLKQDENKTLNLLRNNVLEAAEFAQQYGAAEIIPHLPLPEGGADNLDEAPPPVEKYPQPDPVLQLNILQDLTSTLEKQPSINTVLELVLEGLHRGVGLDRVLFALLTPDKARLKGKFAIGENNDRLIQRFDVLLEAEPLFAHALQQGEARWIRNSRDEDGLSQSLRTTLACESFLIFPVRIRQTPIGLFYADRQPSERPLGEETFSGFRHFGQQACLAIEHLSQKK
ncbi:MAG TPA: HDOD domain-containing protein [Aliiroseovarius sp.]|nr:HDOD domain-containing protein [Aliiroseovarius sp.]